MTPSGTVTTARLESSAAGPIDHLVYLPPGASTSTALPSLYLLHGRGDAMGDWMPALGLLDLLIVAGAVEPVIAVAVDGAWSARAHWWVDSSFEGDPAGAPVETAITRDLITHIDSTFGTSREREHRSVAGYSMGGAGAVRMLLAHPDLFSSALAMSPAVYANDPPLDSNTRPFGAFGEGSERFSSSRFRELGYRAVLESGSESISGRLAITVGSDEPGAEASALFDAVSDTLGVDATLDVIEGGHDWAQWMRAFRQELPALLAARDS